MIASSQLFQAGEFDEVLNVDFNPKVLKLVLPADTAGEAWEDNKLVFRWAIGGGMETRRAQKILL